MISKWTSSKNTPRDPRAEMRKLLKEPLVEGLDEEHKKILEMLIDIRNMSIEDLYRLSDPRYKNIIVEPYNKEDFRKVANQHLAWLKKADEKLIELLQGGKLFSQVTEKEAISTIDHVRKALIRKDQDLVAQNVANYLYILTKVQRKTFGENLEKKPGVTDKNDRNHEVLLALAKGTHAYLNKFKDDKEITELAKKLHDKLPEDSKSDEFVKHIAKRSNNATKLFDATNNYVKLTKDPKTGDVKYTFNKDKEAKDAFENKIANFEPDSLLSFAMGLKGTAYEDYGEQLALALAVSDKKGNRILATQQASPESLELNSGDSPEDEALGGIYFKLDEDGGFSKKQITKILSDWDGATKNTPRSHHYVYQGVNNIKELVPESGNRTIWLRNKEGELTSQNIDSEFNGDLGDENVIDLEDAPKHSFGDMTDINKIPSQVLPIKHADDYAPENPSGPPKGIDLEFNYGGFTTSGVGTVVAKRPKNENKNQCEYGIITAAHNISGGSFKKMEATGLGEFDRKDLKLAIPPSQENNRSRDDAKPNDYALIKLEAACSSIDDSDVATLAETDEKGLVKVRDKEEVFTQKRHEKVEIPGKGTVNSGGGNVVKGKVDFSIKPDTGGYKVNIADKKYKIGGGDSGAPVWNSRNEFIGVMYGGNGRGDDFSFHPGGVQFAKDQLEKWFPNTAPRTQSQSRPQIQFASLGSTASSYNYQPKHRGSNWLYEELKAFSGSGYWRGNVLHSAHEVAHDANTQAGDLSRSKWLSRGYPTHITNRLQTFYDPQTKKQYDMVMPQEVTRENLKKYIPAYFKQSVMEPIYGRFFRRNKIDGGAFSAYQTYVNNGGSSGGAIHSFMDEWFAYLAGLEAGLIEANQEGARKVPWELRRHRPTEFLVYNMAFIQAVNELEPEWWNTQWGENYKELFSDQARRTFLACQESNRRTPSNHESVKVYHRFMHGSDPDIVSLRKDTASFLRRSGDIELASMFES